MNTLAKIRKLKNAFYNLHLEYKELEQKCLELEREKQEMYLDKDFEKNFEQTSFDLETLKNFIS